MTIEIQGDAIQMLLGHAKEIADNNHINLDFSDESVKEIDRLLNHDHKIFKQGEEHDEEGLSGIALCLGAYIGEALRAGLPEAVTQWLHGTPKAGGPDTLYLSIAGAEIYPVDWVAKQIEYGKEESVYKKYHHFLSTLSAQDNS